eukprot:XP_001692597.1 predicted protein [Chlamydomonas reinhardtii]
MRAMMLKGKERRRHRQLRSIPTAEGVGHVLASRYTLSDLACARRQSLQRPCR